MDIEATLPISASPYKMASSLQVKKRIRHIWPGAEKKTHRVLEGCAEEKALHQPDPRTAVFTSPQTPRRTAMRGPCGDAPGFFSEMLCTSSVFLSLRSCRLGHAGWRFARERAFPSAQKACNLQHKVAGAVHLCLFWQEADALLCPTTRRGRIPFPSACPQKRLQLGDSQCILSYLLMCEHV